HCILYMDLDRFKIVNDTCGHMAGDKLLKQLVEIMRRNFRSRDNLSRLGGDEFISVLHHCSVQNAQRIADSILEEVGRYRFYSEDKCFSVGVSIGIAPFCTSNNTPEYALQCADMACYLAKEEGRHRWHVFQADEQSVLENREQVCWASRLTEALHEQRFILMQQAIVAAAPKATDCRQVEVLIRLKDREGKIHPPGAFLPAAFRYNFIQKLDRYVCSHTFRFIQQHKKRLQNTIFHINLTGPTIADKEFLTFVTQELDNAEIDGKSICFEFTETIASSQVTAVKEFIDALSPRGCLFALDDFGAGTASFQQLSNIPIQIVKIDGAFIQALDDPVNYMLVEACCKIARHRNQQIVAEFVSSKEIVARLSGLPIDFYQGFLFAKPEPLSCMLTIESQNPSFEAETLSVNNQ
ncbi:MAG: EAL domain-containing protein, partial [Colwellia sp.]